MNDQTAIQKLQYHIMQLEEDAGWNLDQNLYNRDWKKDVAAAKKQLAEMKKNAQ